MNEDKPNMKQNMSGGFISDIIVKIRLVIKLVQDDRIDMLLKAIPVFCLIYLIVPFDLLIGPLDDALVLYLGMDLFINLCPQDIVNEYLLEIRGTGTSASSDEVIDAEFIEKK
jgi:hypothetical protein